MHELGFWLAIGLASIVSVLLFKYGAVLVGDRLPAYGRLAAAI